MFDMLPVRRLETLFCRGRTKEENEGLWGKPNFACFGGGVGWYGKSQAQNESWTTRVGE